MICYYYDAPAYFFFAPDLPEMLYYSHIPAVVLALLVGIFVFINNPRELLNRILLFIALSFSALALVNLTTWTNIDSRIILFAWSLLGPLQAVISILCIYFIYVFLFHQDISNKLKTLFIILLLPVLTLGVTNLNLSGFDLAGCDAFSYEGELYSLYYNLLGLLAIVWIAILLIKNYKTTTKRMRRQIVFMGIGVESFLFLFVTIFYLADFLTTIQFVEDSRLELYGFFGMIIFMVMMGVLIVRFKSFNVGTHATNALVVALLLLVASQYTYIEHTTGAILISITLTLSAIVSILLIRSVKKEIEQRKELEKLTGQLKKANKRLKILDQMKSEFVSIASHQLRSPLTSIRGYASMLLEGSYGKLTEKEREAIERISESSRYMAMSVEDYLNVSRIEAGRMKYELSDFNLKEMTEHIVDDVRPTAIKKGLVLTSKTSDLTSKGVVYGDIGKTQQIIHNLIDNAIKYTPKGTIMVRLRDNTKKKRIYVDVVDSGVGMEKDSIDDVFEKFVRARNANKVNVTGTGLGLYVAKKMAEGMKGTIIADSEGEGKGSMFTLELPLQI